MQHMLLCIEESMPSYQVAFDKTGLISESSFALG